MKLTFEAPIIEWRGPAPFLFVAVPDQPSRELKVLSAQLTYGWGCIPAKARTGQTSWTTSLFPKDGCYLVPLKKDVQQKAAIEIGQLLTLSVELG